MSQNDDGRGTDAQIEREREIAKLAIVGALAAGYAEATHPGADHWLAAAHDAGARIASLEQEIDAERERAARVCDDEARIRTAAAKKHPPESESEGRCLAAARAAINCAKGIRGSEVVPGPTSMSESKVMLAYMEFDRTADKAWSNAEYLTKFGMFISQRTARDY